MADWLGQVIGWVSPRAGYSRRAWRMAAEALAQHERAYQAAERSRLSSDRFTTGGSFDASLAGDLGEMRRRSRQSFRDNPLMKSAVVNILAWMIGDGIEMRPVHPDPKVAKRAREVWREAAKAPVWGDGQDFYGSQVLRAAEMIKGGESIAMWMPAGRLPDARMALFQGDYVDTTKNELLSTGGRIALGVEYNKAGVEVATWFYETHPGDLLAPFSLKSIRVPASRYSRMFWRTDIGQSRGVPWDHAGQTKLGDVEALKEAIRTKKRVEACVALIVRRDLDDKTGPLGSQTKAADGSTETTLRPGMIMEAGISGGVEVVNPSSSGEGDEFHKAEVRDFCAALGIPYFIATGDVSDANYTTLRADMSAFYKRLDLWQQHTLEPPFAADFHRVMRREALRRGDMALLKVRGEAVMPSRPHVDPLKDGLAEKLDVRGGFASMPTQLARRGIDWLDHLDEVRDFNNAARDREVVFDTNPAMVNNAGAQQPNLLDGDRSTQLETLALRLLED